jgi:acyl-CoA thioester hydrolase
MKRLAAGTCPEMADPNTNHIYRYEFTVPAEAMDENGHVNNVQFVQWMQDVAVRHYESIGGIPPTQALGATWVVRSHQIEYFGPAFAGEVLEARTWIANLRRVRSLRRYEFYRKSDGRLLVRGETDWVFVDATSGRPLAIPPQVVAVFPMLTDGGSEA